jgi:hypothetical protein
MITSDENNKLCKNMNCEQFPPDWDPEQDTEESYEEGDWKKCLLCIGYFNDDGIGDILFIEEEPNNRSGECNLCGKTENIVQMKGTGEYLCENACDESEEDDDDDDEQSEEEINKCDECNIKLDRIRDGSTDKNFRCNNCYWEDNEGKHSENIIKPDYRTKEETEDRYVTCINCNENIDCWNCNIYCLFKGDSKDPKHEITICQLCNDDLREEFEEEGYKCDDWNET